MTIATGSLEGVKILNGRQAEATLAAPIAEAGQNLNLQGFRILITDDVEANREFFAHVLRRAHAECLFACDGQEAVETMRRESCDLILMDIQMPVMDGYAATAALRAAGVCVPIVAITANGTDDDKQRCRDIGFTGYLTKPISIASLLRGVGEQLGVTVEQKPLPARREPAATAIQATSSPTARAERTCTTRPPATLPVDPVFRDFATRFVRKVTDALPEIMSAIDDSNSTTLSGLAHWIKGTGGTVGLPGLTEFGKELHTMAHTEDYAGARSIVVELQSMLTALQLESQCELAVR